MLQVKYLEIDSDTGRALPVDVFTLEDGGSKWLHEGRNPRRLVASEDIYDAPREVLAFLGSGQAAVGDFLGAEWWALNPGATYPSLRIEKNGEEVIPVHDGTGRYRPIPVAEFRRLREKGRIGKWGVVK